MQGITYDIVDGGRDVANSRCCGKAHESHAQEGEELHGENDFWKMQRKMSEEAIVLYRVVGEGR